MQEHIVETWAAYPVVITAFARATGEKALEAFAQSLVDAM
jgi:hypothetical protein